jgi:hypothetical protein
VLCDVENFSTTSVAESRTVWLWLSEPRLRRVLTKIRDQTRRETISSLSHLTYFIDSITTCDASTLTRICLKTNWRKRVRVESV